MRVDFRRLKSSSALRASIKAAMYESSCSYAGALELKRSALKEEPWPTTEWPPYRLHQSTFEQLKQSVEKAKAALQDRSGLLGTATAFGDFYGGHLGQDATGGGLGFGRASVRTDESMLGTIDKGKSLGSEKLSGSLGKGYSTPTLSDTLRVSKCTGKSKNTGNKSPVMATKEYYERWLQYKLQLSKVLEEDGHLQELAKHQVGIKPQGTAVEVVARVYCKYCELFNKLCDCYDQMTQVQRRPYIRMIIDAVTCRIMELKRTLEKVEMLEYTYGDNAMQQLIIIPQDVEVLCPFFYPFEIREQEKQYVIDQIMAGNRIGDLKPTPSELERMEEERLNEEKIKEEEKMAAHNMKLAMGEYLSESEPSIVYTPQELENMRLEAEYNTHLNNIQRMERSRIIILRNVRTFNKDANLYLELAGIKAPKAKPEIQTKACKLIQTIYRRFMELKRQKDRETKVRIKLGMEIPACKPPSFKIELENVRKIRRKFRQEYYEKWVKDTIKENSRVLRLREGNIMEDISVEVREWFLEWYKEVRVFDEYPWPDEGGSILVVRGETFTIDEFIDWQKAELKRLKIEEGKTKTKETIKAEKLAAKEEKKRLALEAKNREIKTIKEYKKQRLNPKNDPGVYITEGNHVARVNDQWFEYQCQWKNIDTTDAKLDAKRGHIMQIITEIAYQDANLQLRPIVDEMMRLELSLLKTALKNDYKLAGITTLPLTRKRKKPRKVKIPKPDKETPARMFQQLVDGGIVKKYPRLTLDDYWGDRNYAAADLRAIPWKPKFPPACVGDVREQVRVRCLLALGSECNNAERTHLLVGPKSAGKRTLVYAIATETNSILIDLSPMNVFDKFPGKKQRKMFFLINKISRIMQPTIIMVDNADKLFYKNVPKEERMFNPTRLQKDFYKEIVKPIKDHDKILVLGTASEPWLAKGPQMAKAFRSTIMVPRSDYGTISFTLKQMLSKYHGVPRDFNVHSIAQAVRGYAMNSIIKGVELALAPDRVPKLYHKPLQPVEILRAVLDQDGTYTDDYDNNMFHEWYLSYSPWGQEYLDLLFMLETQYQMKLKEDKKTKKIGGDR